MDDVATLSQLATLLTAALEAPPNDVGDSTHFQIHDGNGWIPVQKTLWRAWAGPRAIWGVPYHGPVYSITSPDDTVPWDGPRACRCETCQSHVSPFSRPN